MACDDPTFDAARDPGRCKCKAAVERAYQGMLKAGQPECVALDAAKTIYTYHHPEDPKDVAQLTVERWVYAGNFH